MKHPYLSTLKSRLHVHGWFFLINSILTILISLRYLVYMPMPKDFLTWLYTLVTVGGHMPLMTAVFALAVLPIILIPHKMIRTILLVVMSSIGIGLLIIDTLVFDQYRFHLNIPILELVLSGGIVEFPIVTWITLIFGFLVLFFL